MPSDTAVKKILQTGYQALEYHGLRQYFFEKLKANMWSLAPGTHNSINAYTFSHVQCSPRTPNLAYLPMSHIMVQNYAVINISIRFVMDGNEPKHCTWMNNKIRLWTSNYMKLKHPRRHIWDSRESQYGTSTNTQNWDPRVLNELGESPDHVFWNRKYFGLIIQYTCST